MRLNFDTTHHLDISLTSEVMTRATASGAIDFKADEALKADFAHKLAQGYATQAYGAQPEATQQLVAQALENTMLDLQHPLGQALDAQWETLSHQANFPSSITSLRSGNSLLESSVARLQSKATELGLAEHDAQLFSAQALAYVQHAVVSGEYVKALPQNPSMSSRKFDDVLASQAQENQASQQRLAAFNQGVMELFSNVNKHNTVNVPLAMGAYLKELHGYAKQMLEMQHTVDSSQDVLRVNLQHTPLLAQLQETSKQALQVYHEAVVGSLVEEHPQAQNPSWLVSNAKAMSRVAQQEAAQDRGIR